VGGEYFFIAYDTDLADMPATAVPLKAIKRMFDGAKSKQVCLWLDFCHSGGILARRAAAVDDDFSIIKRALQVVQGQGKVIYAACSPSQSAYEDPKIGHGLFTHALLLGLRGKAIANREVTISSLFDFIDREVGSHRQRPEFFGHLQGRMVLMHFGPSPKSSRPTKQPPRTKAPRSGTWVLLDRHFLIADSVRDNGDSTITVRITPEDQERNAIIAGLRSSRQPIAFAYHTDAAQVSVRDATSEAVGSARTWTLTLRSDSQDFGYSGSESALQENGRHYSADDIATLRARRILLNDPPPPPPDTRPYFHSTLETFIASGLGGRFLVKECPIRSVYVTHGTQQDWKEFARLLAIYYLKASGTVEHVVELKLGAVRAGKLAVAFRGRRRQYYSNADPTVIEVKGDCPLK
jgi:hypothetical protein